VAWKSESPTKFRPRGGVRGSRRRSSVSAVSARRSQAETTAREVPFRAIIRWASGIGSDRRNHGRWGEPHEAWPPPVMAVRCAAPRLPSSQAPITFARTAPNRGSYGPQLIESSEGGSRVRLEPIGQQSQEILVRWVRSVPPESSSERRSIPMMAAKIVSAVGRGSGRLGRCLRVARV